MSILNFEFKARCRDLHRLEVLLRPFQPYIAGEDVQEDTYFNVAYGRLKLRQGTIENALIHYQRPDVQGARQSNVLLYQLTSGSALKQLLTAALGIKKVVKKKRKILFVENVKFHFDQVDHLGAFVEVEAIDRDGTIGLRRLQEQCSFYAQLFDIFEEDYVAFSYSDLLD